VGLFSARRVKRIAPGRYRIALPEPERDLLRTLVPQLRDLLTTDDPSLNRLFPTAYADDPERDAGYHALVRDELLEKRFHSLDVLERTVEGGEVDEETLSAWMRALNDLRLVLGTRLDVSEDDDPMDIDPDDPMASAWAIYHYLAGLQSMIIDALSQEL
jgi:hypothetical protein